MEVAACNDALLSASRLTHALDAPYEVSAIGRGARTARPPMRCSTSDDTKTVQERKVNWAKLLETSLPLLSL